VAHPRSPRLLRTKRNEIQGSLAQSLEGNRRFLEKMGRRRFCSRKAASLQDEAEGQVYIKGRTMPAVQVFVEVRSAASVNRFCVPHETRANLPAKSEVNHAVESRRRLHQAGIG
jgi:hypothetical protein